MYFNPSGANWKFAFTQKLFALFGAEIEPSCISPKPLQPAQQPDTQSPVQAKPPI
jgi:hypothetical protein